MAAVFNSILKNPQAWGGVTLALVAGSTLVPHTLMLDYYKTLMQQLRNGQPEEVDPELCKLIEQANDKMHLTPEKEASINVFTCFSHDPVHKGSTNLRSGALVGLPGSFKYRQEKDVFEENMNVNRATVDWSSPVCEQLANSLLLSDDAKKFAYVREVFYTDTSHVHVDLLLRGISGFLAYTTGFNLNRKLKLKSSLKMWARGSLYTVIASAWFLMYVFMKDMYSFSQDNKADRRAAALGKEYAEGGVEYYTRVLKRNQSIREIMGTEGPFYYTVFGNDVATWRTKTVQLTKRRDNLISLRQGYDKDRL